MIIKSNLSLSSDCKSTQSSWKTYGGNVRRWKLTMREHHKVPAASGPGYLWFLLRHGPPVLPLQRSHHLFVYPDLLSLSQSPCYSQHRQYEMQTLERGEMGMRSPSFVWISDDKSLRKRVRQSISLCRTSVWTQAAVKPLGSCVQICSFCSNPQAFDDENSSLAAVSCRFTAEWQAKPSMTHKKLDKCTPKHT